MTDKKEGATWPDFAISLTRKMSGPVLALLIVVIALAYLARDPLDTYLSTQMRMADDISEIRQASEDWVVFIREAEARMEETEGRLDDVESLARDNRSIFCDGHPNVSECR